MPTRPAAPSPASPLAPAAVHDHGHAHEHRPARPKVKRSLLGTGLAARLAIAVAASGLLWLTLNWAMRT